MKTLAALMFCLAVGSACKAQQVDDSVQMLIAEPGTSTSDAEIIEAVRELVETYPVCIRVKAARFDSRVMDFDRLPAAPWFSDKTDSQLDLLVRLGFFEKTTRPELGARVAEFRRTERGAEVTDDTRTRFCIPAERKLQRVESIERSMEMVGCGYVRVRFTHIEDQSSVWTRAALARVGSRAATIRADGEGLDYACARVAT